jgi:hypothetical protein
MKAMARNAPPAVARCRVARVRSFSNISWSSLQNHALGGAEFIRAGRDQRNSKASIARTFAIQDLALLTLVGLIRITEPNGVKVAEFSSILTSTTGVSFAPAYYINHK